MRHNNKLILSITFISILIVTVSSYCNQSIPLTLPNGSIILNCTSCPTGYFINESGLVTYLSNPFDNSSITSDYLYYCPMCISNCAVCTNTSICGICQQNYYLNLNSTCSNCSGTFGSHCEACNFTHCQQCSGTTVLNFSSSDYVCVYCNLYKCQTCTNGPTCLICQNGYYLNSSISLCMPCHYPCLTCNNSAIQCLSCNRTIQKYYFNNNTNRCPLCYHSIPNCTLCSSNGLYCYLCTSNLFYLDLNGTVCNRCASPCLTCRNSSYCQSCIDFNYTISSLNNSCVSCDSVIPHCTSCVTQSVCMTCENSTTSTYYLMYPPKACVLCDIVFPHCLGCNQTASGPICVNCTTKYFVDNSTKGCTACPVACAECISTSVCTSCVDNTFMMNGTMCKPCHQLIPNCARCNNSLCYKCTNLTRVLTNTGVPNCTACNPTEYADQIAQYCYSCVSPCTKCLSQTDCLDCEPYYEIVTSIKRCRDICGDGVIKYYQCDNGLGIPNDGCSDKCIRQPDWICNITNSTVNFTSVNISICSYNKTVEITLISIQKQRFANQLTWTYTIKPYLYGLPGTTSTIYNFNDLKKIFQLYDIVYGAVNSSYIPVNAVHVSGITILSINYDSSTSKVQIKISYEKELKYSNMVFNVNFAYLKSINVPYFDYTLDSNHNMTLSSYLYHSMIGKLYTDQQYSKAKSIYYAGLIISVLSFLAFLIGIFSKEVVGLEMAMLSQFTYISLFYYQNTLQLPFYSLKSLVYSTGFNIPWQQKIYPLLTVDAPQARVLQFDSMTLVNNFNLMTLLYILPLIAILPFIPLKGKCIKKLTYIEMGHKWVDLLLGQILLAVVLFNYQYYLLNTVLYYRDRRNIANWSSTMIVWIGGLISIGSFLGLFFKPEIYGNFRTAFRFNTQLRSQVLQQNENKKLKIEGKLGEITQRFQKQQKCVNCKKSYEKFLVFINENYFWRNWRTVHKTLTYNHYNILIFYFTASTLCLTLIPSSQIIIIILSFLIMMELILLRPYGQISQKFRSIYFFFAYTFISCIRYMNNKITKSQYNQSLPQLVLLVLFIALIWTYLQLIIYFINSFRYEMSNRNIVVTKVFNDEAQNILDKEVIPDQQQALMRKLMKRYQRIQLQYNINDARNQLIQVYGSQNNSNRNLIAQNNQQNDQDNLKPRQKDHQTIINKLNSQQNYKTSKSKTKKQLYQKTKQILKQAQQNKNYKDIKQKLEKQKKKKKKKEMKNKVTGQKMLKLLKLDNFNKYQQQFLMDQQQKKKIDQQRKKQRQKVQVDNKQGQKISAGNQIKQNQNNNLRQLIKKQQQQSQQISQLQSINQKNEYKSVQPKNLQQAQQKIEQQIIIMQQNEHIRYKRAIQVITNQGLDLDHELIKDNYDII